MKIMHSADLHLSSKMETSLSPEQARERRRELMSTFFRMTEYAKSNNIPAFIISGDIFDSVSAPKKVVNDFISCIAACPSTDFFCICGNHDRECFEKARSLLPQNLMIFSKEWKSYKRQNVTFTGRDVLDPEMYEELQLDASCFNIVILHGTALSSSDANDTNERDSISLARLKNKNIDYLALGHLHSFSLRALDERGLLCYPGCPEGRGFDECGPKGFILLDTDAGKEEAVSFVPICQRQLHEVNVDIDQNDLYLADFEKKINEALKDIPSTDMVKVTLRGYTASEAEKDIGALCHRLNEKFYFARIKDLTSLYINEKDYIGDITLKGSFIRIISKLQEQDELLRDVAECGIRALRGEDIE